jgi:starch synthase (maltosyl-transferring)
MAATTLNAPRIYNLFPRYFESIEQWSQQLARIVSLGFNAVYVNPFHATGGSGSLYAVADYYRVNPQFVAAGEDGAMALRAFTAAARGQGLAVYMDLVINHTANESVLVVQHPQWFKRDGAGALVHPFAVDPSEPSRITVWGDLAEINYLDNPHFEQVRHYWDCLIDHYQQMGFSGFRCDAAYKVPCAMWQPLIRSAKMRDSQTVFLAETLGCTPQQTLELAPCGFDYFFNSSKWWDFEGSWAVDQHAAYRDIAPSISFPESHDTERVAAQQPGSIEYQKNRYALALVFSKALLMPLGYEYGATRRLDVVNSRPQDGFWGKWDLSAWLSHVNKFKQSTELLCQEGHWEVVGEQGNELLFMLRQSDDRGTMRGFIVNKNLHEPRSVGREQFPWQFGHFTQLIRLFNEPILPSTLEQSIPLGPCEIVLLSS